MKYLLLLFIPLFYFNISYAVTVQGRVTDANGQPLPFASVYVKGTTHGTSASAEGLYNLDLLPGKYIIVCQYLGCRKEEKTIEVENNPLQVNFSLSPTQFRMKAVVIKAGGEDPAYRIIRHAISKRAYYLNQVKEFTCEAYIKGKMNLLNTPERILGQKTDLDSTMKGIFFLSESLSRIAVKWPDKYKINVISARESGNSNGYGFNVPDRVNLYKDNVTVVTPQLNPRGFVSPIAGSALNFYRYRLEGTYTDEGHTVYHIRVIPKRKFEPLFSGYIDIMDESWRIYSTALELTKDAQMQLVDTLQLRQLYIPVNDSVWMLNNQVIPLAVNFMGVKVKGQFLYSYSQYNIAPDLPAGYFNKVVMEISNGANKKPLAYWDSIRPVPLDPEEIRDFVKKDSLEKVHQQPAYLDSVDRANRKVSVMNLLVSGISLQKTKQHAAYYIPPVPDMLQYNTVEGLVLEPGFRVRNRLSDQWNDYWSADSHIRYGFSNRHLNAFTDITWQCGSDHHTSVSISGGKKVCQFDNRDPISPFLNSLYTLLRGQNYAKFYEAWFGRITAGRDLAAGLHLSLGIQYQDRIPLVNTTDYSFAGDAGKHFTPNLPDTLASMPFVRNQALSATVSLTYQPGQKLIRYPDHTVSLPSRYPYFSLSYTKGIPSVLGSDVNYDQYHFSVYDNLNLHLLGRFSYRATVGGFLSSREVQLPDYQHYMGNQTLAASPYLGSFQLMPYYTYSNTANFYASLHGEYHFNGLLTNKIPLFRRLNWWLVAGSNALLLNGGRNYVEISGGLENIFKLLRVDVVGAYPGNSAPLFGIRIGLSSSLFAAGE